jgi:hypothetical protein
MEGKLYVTERFKKLYENFKLFTHCFAKLIMRAIPVQCCFNFYRADVPSARIGSIEHREFSCAIFLSLNVYGFR